MKKVVVKILQGIYTNHVRWANYISSGANFLQCICNMCQKLWKMAGSRL